MSDSDDDERVGLLSPDRAKKERPPRASLSLQIGALLVGTLVGFAFVRRFNAPAVENEYLRRAIAQREAALDDAREQLSSLQEQERKRWSGTVEAFARSSRSLLPPSAPGGAAASRSGRALEEARTHGPYYGDLEAAGELEKAIEVVSRRGELVLLHGDHLRLRMLVNLIAELNSHAIFHILLLGFSEDTCDRLRARKRIGCAHSSFLRAPPGRTARSRGASAELVEGARRWELAPKYVAWIQKFRYIRLLLEARVNLLALDSDVLVATDPYPHLRGAFGGYTLVTMFDTKGGFANTNVGVMYIQNATIGGPVHGLFVEFERRVRLALRLPPPTDAGQRAARETNLFWDQNLFNKVLLSALAGRALYLPDDSDRGWREGHADLLTRLSQPKQSWRAAADVSAPDGLTVRDPWYPRASGYLWWPLDAASVAAAASVEAGGAAAPSSGDGGAAVEKLLLAPPWLISADNTLGHRYRHILYGARPPPWVLLHFVCVAAGEHSRILPMRLFGRWHNAAVNAEAAPPPKPSWDRRTPRRLLALTPGSLDEPMAPQPWGRLNALHALLGGLALMTNRTAVLPALQCTGLDDRFLAPGNLPGRCFWHVHTRRGVACVFRIGCGEDGLASPAELDDEIARAAAAGGPPPPPAIAVALGGGAAATDRALRELRDGPQHGAMLARVRLELPPDALGGGNDDDDAPLAATRAAAPVALATAMHDFGRVCPELTDRSKKRKRECTNLC